MKFIHISDVYLGTVPDAGMIWGESRAKELWDSFGRVIDDCNRERADVLLISGDLFGRLPSVKEMDEALAILSRLKDTQVFITAGDKDRLCPASLYQICEWPEHVHLLGEGGPRTYELPYPGVKVQGISLTGDRTCREDALKCSPVIGEDYNILMFSAGELTQDDVYMIATAGFDYVAMGGKAQCNILEREKAAYPGTLEPLEPGNAKHGYILGEIDDGGTRLTFVATQKRSYRKIELDVRELSGDEDILPRIRKRISDEGSNNIFTVRLTGAAQDSELTDAVKRCGNVLGVEYSGQAPVDIKAVKAMHSEDIVGKYIDLLEKDKRPEAAQAMELGVRTLLDSGR